MADSSDTAIGKRACLRRKALGLSQEKAAEILGFTQSKLSRLEHGIGANDLYNLRVIAAGYNCPLHSLIFGDLDEKNMNGELSKAESKKKPGKIKVDDPKGAIFSALSDIGSTFGRNSVVLNRGEEEEITKKGWSVLTLVRESKDPSSAAAQVSNVLLANTSCGGGEDSYWEAASANLLSLLILYAAKVDEANLAEVISGMRTDEGRKRLRENFDENMLAMYTAFIHDRNAGQILSDLECRIKDIKKEQGYGEEG